MGMHIGRNIETLLILSVVLVSIMGSFLIIRINWKLYGALFLLSGAAGTLICLILYLLGLYAFPFRLFQPGEAIPLELTLIVFPFFVLFTVRFSPKSWGWKLAYYMVFVHLAALAEALVENNTQIIKYSAHWQLWESYFFWWLFLLSFEGLAGRIVPPANRKPPSPDFLRFGHAGWVIAHVVFMFTVYLAGLYARQVFLG